MSEEHPLTYYPDSLSEPRRSLTVVESDEEIQQALLANAAQAQQRADAAVQAAKGRPAVAFRPTNRPPMALLTVFDDGKMDGETVRIRNARFVIGRSEGDLRIPFDGRMSSRHVEITCQQIGGMNRWVVTDLQSTNGLFVRVRRTLLADKAELLVGDGLYRFDAPQMDAAATVDHLPGGLASAETHGWGGSASPFRPAALTERIGAEIGNRVILTKGEYWIGTDPSCAICRPDDPFCETRHARLYRNSKSEWLAEHNNTLNGLWLRMPQITVDPVIQFQIGEQRFRLRVF